MSLVPSVNGFEIDAGQEIPGEFEEISFAPVAGIIKFPENTSDPDAIPPHDCKPFDIDSDLPMEEYCATGIPHSPCDPMPITVDVPCYTTVYVDTLPEEGIQGIMYVVPNGDLYAVYMWDGEQFNAVTSSSILQALTVNPSSTAQDILPEQGYDGFSSVHVNPIPPEYIIPSGTKNITQNGNGQDVAAYEYVNVNVPTVTPTGEKTINVSQNGTVTEDVTNYASAKVVTNVPNTYSASDEGKVVQNGALASQTSLSVTQNGTYVTTTNNEVVVDVSGGDPDTWDWKEDGKHHIWINITVPENLTQRVAIKTQNTSTYAEIDWGDGSAVDSMHSSTAQTFTHTYAALGKYEIKITRTAGTGYIQITGGIDDARCISNIYALEYSNLFSTTVRTIPHAFNLKYVNIGKSGNGGNTAFGSCGLKEYVGASATNATGNYYLQGCIDLRTVDLGDTTTIGQCAFESTGIREITIPATVTNIANQSFRYTVNLIAIHLKGTTPPTLANTQAFTGTRSDLKFYVPYSADHSVLAAYQAAANWSTYASQMVEETP